MTAPVFIAAPGSLDDLAPGEQWTLTGPEARHAANVQRLRVGEPIEVVDGAGVRLVGAIAPGGPATATSGVVVEVLSLRREEHPAPRLVLVQALAKGGRDEMAVEAATELGVDAVRPWQAERSVVQWRGDKVARGEQRWQAIVASATKVARRAWLPQVRPFVRGDALVPEVAQAVATGSVVLLLHEQASASIGSVALDGVADIVMIVGPEGGISDGEVAALTTAGAQPALMGPNVLRSSTAGPAALAVLSQRLGRWG